MNEINMQLQIKNVSEQNIMVLKFLYGSGYRFF